MKYVALAGSLVLLGLLGYLLANTGRDYLAARRSDARHDSAGPADDHRPAAAALAGDGTASTVAVHVFDRAGKLVGPVPAAKVELTAAAWQKRLSPEAFDVLRNQGTELPGSGTYVDTDDDGVYCCAGCGLPLFSSDAKFHSGTGWPSFFQPIAPGNVAETVDRSDGMVRTEIHCPRCGGHLGHVFDDGPKPTGLRYCLDSVALNFTPRNKVATLADPAADSKPRDANGSSAGVRAAPAAISGAGATKKLATAVFAAGCFWATEAAFDQIRGVEHVVSGYSGGSKDTANYDTVCGGDTGHAESVEVTYDPSQVSYEQLLDVFFAAHDPTQLNRQGNDTGTQYRSVIFYADDAQRRAAEAKVRSLGKSHAFADPIVTAIEPLKSFFPAEDYHQNYVHNHPDEPYIQGVSIPKVKHVRQKYPELIKSDR